MTLNLHFCHSLYAAHCLIYPNKVPGGREPRFISVQSCETPILCRQQAQPSSSFQYFSALTQCTQHVNFALPPGPCRAGARSP